VPGRHYAEALPCRYRRQPSAQLVLIFNLMKMLDQFQAYGLKDVRRVRSPEAKLYGDRINEPAIAHDERFPCPCIAVEAHCHQFRIRLLAVRRRCHYRGFLDFQKLSRAKKSITTDE